MNYSDSLQIAKKHFPKYSNNLLKESEFHLFNDEPFGLFCVNFCLNLSKIASKKFNILLCFAVDYNIKMNASVYALDEYALIIFNSGLIENIKNIVSNSMELLISEDFANYTMDHNDKDELHDIILQCCLTNLFYHEFAHVIQLSDKQEERNNGFSEHYSIPDSFILKKHVYEIDADYFGISMSLFHLIQKIRKLGNPLNHVILFNAVTGLLFVSATFFIEFSGKLFDEIYFIENSHPHPFIRIANNNEQVLYLLSQNISVNKRFLELILSRTGNLIRHIKYSNSRQLEYSEVFKKNERKMNAYISQVENVSLKTKELTRFKSQIIYDKLRR